MFAFTN